MARFCRSRKGAWIEIEVLWQNLIQMLSRSRKGAWIEIGSVYYFSGADYVAPVRERGLKYILRKE